MPSPDKVTIHLETSIQLEVTDNGYLGSDVTIAKHLEKAQRDADNRVNQLPCERRAFAEVNHLP